MDFKLFKNAVSKQFVDMTENNAQLFVVDVGKDELWNTYLASFPEGSNPIMKERTEHDCQACRHFIRDVGAVVTVTNDADYYLQFLEEIDGAQAEVTQWEAGFIEDMLRKRPRTLSSGRIDIIKRMARQYLHVEI